MDAKTSIKSTQNTSSTPDPLRVGIIGTGRPWKSDGATGFGMAHAHANGYNLTGKCRIVALADIVTENARIFNEQKADGKAEVFADYHQMLRDLKPDVVSVCTIPALHAPMVIAACEAGVRAIHCEKPMAGTLGEARQMRDAARASGVQLTFNHQRRFNTPFATARRLISDGAIGQIVRIEGACGDMLDWGTHWINMFLYYNNDTPARWVMGQVDARQPKTVFGVPMETQGMSLIHFENEVTGLVFTGDGADEIVGCANRIIGATGTLEVHNSAPHVRLRRVGDADFAPVPGADEGGIHSFDAVSVGIADLIDALETGRTPVLDVSNAFATTEIIYATYESARRRGRVDLPLDVNDNPFAALLEASVFPEAVSQAI